MDESQRVIRALASPVRREILWRVWEAERPVAAIAAGLGLAPATISQHLTVLREAGLVEVRADGTTRWYLARRDAIDGLRRALGEGPERWTRLTDRPERLQDDERAERALVTVLTVDAPCSCHDAFRAVTDAVLYARWLGAPVTIADDGAFTCRMEFGTVVRGVYELTVEPSLVVMRWDFDDGTVPVPGAGHRALLVLRPDGADRCRLELHQHADEIEHLHRLERAWRAVLDRFAANITRALDPTADAPLRPARSRRPARPSPPDAGPSAPRPRR